MGFLHSLMRNIAVAWNRILLSLMLPDPSRPNDAYLSNSSYENLSSTLNAIPDLMFELDAEGRHWDFRALRPELLVAPPEKLLGHTVSDVMPVEAAEAVMNALNETILKGYSHGTHIHLPTPIGDRWFEVSMARKENITGEEPRFIALSRDITERKKRQIETERLAYIDPLTELPNRHLLRKRLQLAIAASKKSGQYSALLFLDLDNFKTLNDTKGHDAGDLLLQLMAQRLRASVRKEDIVARWGGDEFVIMIQGLDHDRERATEKASLICEQMIGRLNIPYELNGYEHECKASIGINLFESNEQDIDQIIKRADTAMYSAKHSNSDQYSFFNT